MASCLDEENKVIIKKDWYQTESQVIVSILGKHTSEEDCCVIFNDDEVTIQAKFATGQPYTLQLKLSKHIVPNFSTYRVLSSKLELRLAKIEGGMWDVLERTVVKKTKSSSIQPRNWDKVVKDMTKEEEDSDVNTLFKKIYSDGSDEVRKAMNKSFMESGGTVLSTNWRDVAKDKVDIKPPEGMEWKKWDE
ncbi:protein SGT1 homolog [Myzus persicae]|uniref:protein SGT1 homolog n=1 Tax=Myzus persicae TaxID=13164 RepID=UPI000B936626|nr:protein SGT1 homolog [Myzus persicae]XP_022172598.1 protein SGT1 homolog [Myzus persicae]XP_022172599.1 protein SGT1 homolog [Myzus persicae]XP_022172601.1 protein SGT1 homolog [Myzus persicae]